MRTSHLSRFLLLSTLVALPVRADVAVVVHPDNPVQSLTAKEVSDLYLGRLRAIGSGESPLLLDQPRNSPLRERFFHLLNGMTLPRVNAYWARLQFSGDTQPPAQLTDSQNIIEAVRRHRSAMGYVDTSQINDGVRVVLRLKE